MLDVTFFSKDQVSGNQALDIFKNQHNWNQWRSWTDAARLMSRYCLPERQIIPLATMAKNDTYLGQQIHAIDQNSGQIIQVGCGGRGYGSLVALPPETVEMILPMCRVKNVSGQKVFQWGHYPQTAMPDDMTRLISHQARPINWFYDLAEVQMDYRADDVFYTQRYEIHQWMDNHYIPYKRLGETGFELGDGRRVHLGRTYWLKIEPVKWLLDEKSGWAGAQKILYSGIPLVDYYERDPKGDFSKILARRFLQNNFLADLVQFDTPLYSKTFLMPDNSVQITPKNIKTFVIKTAQGMRLMADADVANMHALIGNHFGNDACRIFDAAWTDSDPQRIIRLNKIIKAKGQGR